MKLLHTLKMKMILLCTITSIFLSLLLSYQIYRFMHKSFEREQIQTVNYNLDLIASNIERELDNLYQVILFCLTNIEISRFASGMKNQAYTSYPISMTAYEQLNAKIFNSSIENYINKIILVSKTGEFIIQGKSYGINKDVEICRNLPYFDALLNASDYEWIGLQPELFSSSRPGTSSLPIIRPLINSSTGAINGWLYIALDPSFVAGKLTSHPQAFDSTYYWMIENKAYRYDNGNFVETHLCIQDASPSDTSSLLYLTENEDNKKALCISTRNAPWMLIQTLPDPKTLFSYNEFEKIIIPYILILLISFLVLGYILKRTVSDPVTKISCQIDSISGGNFTTDSSLETSDEFGHIGKGINVMSMSIQRLMNQQLETEHEKRQLELDNLQNQISPHFLYNTLYTIKWMAIIQNAPGITEMLDSLTQIMKNISKNKNSKITLRDELELLNHYITIQRYRYGDSFSYSLEVENEELLNSLIFKFSLQPLIENAIFHGLSTKKQPGQIHLRVKKEQSDLIIIITDNGIGISQREINRILSTAEDITEEQIFKKIGLKNINRRLQLEYGEHYGIRIRSELNQFTEVTIRYPIMF